MGRLEWMLGLSAALVIGCAAQTKPDDPTPGGQGGPAEQKAPSNQQTSPPPSQPAVPATPAQPAQPAFAAVLDGQPMAAFKNVTAIWQSKDGYMYIDALNGDESVTPYNWESLTLAFGGVPGTYDCTQAHNYVSYT